MIVVKLMGGLGNQMFQYAAGKALSARLGVPLLLDKTFLDYKGAGEGYTLRDYELDVFSIDASIANKSEVSRMSRPIQSKLFRSLSENFPSFFKDQTFSEMDCKSPEEFLSLKDPVYLNGYWQSENYFSSIATQLRKTDFVPKLPFSGLNAQLLQKIRVSNSISLHVRRTDYVTNSSTNEFHGTCSPEYYEHATQFLMEQKGIDHCFVFSDDVEWSKANLQLPIETTFISHNVGKESYWDMMLMKECKHHIIANSSFSWWGAWLNDHKGKMVIAPKKWFKDPNADASNIVPKEWVRM